MGPLLIHSADVPAYVREALQAAYAAEPDEQETLLNQAARLLHRATDLECADVKELVGLHG
ncbi:MAG: hypothetical protein SFX73_07735 [Kofleriaceae bacterium]|nr:hypothetical protein [Kofleriaceae bacterium]